MTLIDVQDGRNRAQRDFRAEKFGADQMALFEALGFGPALRACTTATKEVVVVRYGRLAYREAAREWGAPYPALVRAVREALPPGLLRPGRVADLTLGPDRQEVTLGDGSRLTARLVVLATGLGQALHARAGLRRCVLSPRHSLAVGFDMAAPRDRFPFPALTYFSERFGGRDAYLTLFPLGSVMRANLFCYRDPGEAWVADLRRDPVTTLQAMMPRLADACPDLAIAGPVEVRPIDLTRTEGVERDGLVVIGDAFQTACPIPGTGVSKLLTDADRLARVHVPAWLATPGMGRDKIAAFYADPVKRACDTHSLRASIYARGLAVETGALWRARRLRNRVARTAIHVAKSRLVP
ncbi:2-polyprenyl-6-methoxyphenol hydroxylase-like FAD-dependent oxidoreductase [Methylobacterium sp. 1030]